jgi:hypothetical protein
MCLIVSIFSEGHVVLFICCLNFEKNIVILDLELNVSVKPLMHMFRMHVF